MASSEVSTPATERESLGRQPEPSDAQDTSTETSEITPSQHSKRIGRNVVFIVIGELLGKCATLAFTIVVARQLGTDAFGSFSYALALGLLLGTFVSWGFDAQLIRRGSADRKDLDAALTEVLMLRTMHAVPIVAVGILLALTTRPSQEAATAAVLILLATVIDGYGDTGRAAATASEQPGRPAAALVAQRIAACVLAISALAAGGGLVAVSAAYLLSSVIGQVILMMILKRLGIRLRFRQVRRTDLTTMWRGSFLLGLDTVVAMALSRIDTLMLGEMDGDRAVALYAVAYRLMETVLFVTWAVSRALIPSMVRAESGRALLRVGENALAVAAVLLIPYGTLLMVDGDQVLWLLFGSEYAQGATSVLQWLAFAPVAFAFSYYGGYLLFSRGHNRALLMTSVLGLVLNVGLNFYLIPAHGAVGAAAATTVSYTVEGLLSFAVLVRGNGIFRLDRALALSVGAAIPMAAALVLLDLNILLEILVAGLIYLGGYVLLARWRDPGQLALVRSLVSRR